MKLNAHAKLNLGLSVVARRFDDYHEIDTVFVRLELCDSLTITPEARGVQLRVAGATLPSGQENLAYRAAEAYLQAAGEPRGVRIELEKRIPVASGLGGGSSDAAAVLRALAALYPAELELPRLAKSLGSDVPFFLADISAARGRGRGERLTPLTLPTLHAVLVNPGIAVSAGEAYQHLKTFSGWLEPETMIARLQAGDDPKLLNALQPGVLRLYPEIRQALQVLRKAALRGVLMSGSGSTCFGLAQSAEHAEQAAQEIARTHREWWVRAVKSC